MPALETTAADLIQALTWPEAKPTLLYDALRMKRERGDADADQFKAVACRDFAVKLNASINGAKNAMTQWLAKGAVKDTAERRAFLADLIAIEEGTFERRAA